MSQLQHTGPVSCNNFVLSLFNIVNGSARREDIRYVNDFFPAIKSGRGLIRGFWVGEFFRRMQHYSELMDTQQLIESHLFSKANIEKVKDSPADLMRLHIMASDTVQKLFEMLIKITMTVEGRNMQEFQWPKELVIHGTFLNTPEVAAEAMRKALEGDDKYVPKERRERLRGVLADVVERNKDILNRTDLSKELINDTTQSGTTDQQSGQPGPSEGNGISG